MTDAAQQNTLPWRTMSFPSGTCIVTSNAPDSPHLYVYGPKPVGKKDGEGDDVAADRIRYRMCDELAEWMNGGARPKWMGEMERVSETEIVGADGSSITAVGPSYDANPPHLDWQQRDDDAAKDARARLIDRLYFGQKVIPQL